MIKRIFQWGSVLSLLLVLGGGLFAYTQVSNQEQTDGDASLKSTVKRVAQASCSVCYSFAKKVVRKIKKSELTDLSFYLMFIVLLALERIVPVDKKQRLFSRALGHDCLWFVAGASVLGVLVYEYRGAVNGFYDAHLSFLTITSIGELPSVLQLVIVFLVSDLLNWLHHFLRHKIRLLWCFHTVHHSQRALNVMTDARIHPVEQVVAITIRFVPFLSLGPTAAFPTALAWILFVTWYTRLCHCNIRSNFGMLRYVLVTPQSHRIHHSVEDRHRDKNFGVVFSIWDHLFGTQYRNYDEYPATGISDKDFPMEDGHVPALVTFAKQLYYPFQLAGRVIAGKAR